MQIAEALKFNFGNADIEEASETETVQVEVVGENPLKSLRNTLLKLSQLV